MAISASHIPTIYVVTPCLNAVETIDRTLQSVLMQSGNFHLQYHVQDGGSTDGTWERISWWKHHLKSSSFLQNCGSITFTAARESDVGIYDAIYKGFSSFYVPANSFMTWINADDILFPGCLAFIADLELQFRKEQVSWVGGATALIKDDKLISFWDFPRPTSALRLGLCDGRHWDFLQQEGTFFRGWLWRAAKPETWFSGIHLAGDWNLWRQFAQVASLVQSSFPLSGFRVRDGQLSSQENGQRYREEIDKILPAEKRRSSLRSLFEQGSVTRRIIRGKYPGTTNYVYEEDITTIGLQFYKRTFGDLPHHQHPFKDKTLLLTGAATGARNSLTPTKHVEWPCSEASNIFSYNCDWQTPAKTEHHAYYQLAKLWAPADKFTGYLAFPWATLIDHLQCDSSDADKWIRIVRNFASSIPEYSRKVTVCQHILLKQYLRVFKDCGISDIFWAHTTKAEAGRASEFGIRLHPFPLFPVSYSEALAVSAERNFLFSFVGAKPSGQYLTQSRSVIHKHLTHFDRGLVRLRDTWHFNDAVYSKQILGAITQDDEAAQGNDAAKEFREVMSRSIFSLCPSGTGPNSIRLWESLGAGAIPVIMADTLALPGDPALWEEAAVFCSESEEAIKALPEHLAKLAEDTDLLERKRLAMRQLWLKYGPDCFVYDVLKLLVDEGGKVAASSSALEAIEQSEDVPALVGIARQIASGQTDLQSAGNILWRGLATRAKLSSPDLQMTARRYPELLVAARLTKNLLGPDASGQLRRGVLEALPDLR